jgi:crotonobetainyl-CoA:carnitine CoA-transferase CaiB-like acyl-CoA transferase
LVKSLKLVYNFVPSGFQWESYMATPLSGLQVLDLSSGPAGGLATMILADFGATVCRVIDPEYDCLNNIPSAPMWLRGKSVVDSIRVQDVDVVVISQPHAHVNCTFENCRDQNPALIYCEVSAMGSDVNIPMYEGIVAAKAGRMKQFESILIDQGPCFPAVQVATHATAMNIVSGILAALHKRARSGSSEKVTTTLLQGMMPYDVGVSITLQLIAQNKEEPIVYPTMPMLKYQPVQCADGKWIQLGNLLDHLFENFMQVIGLQDELAGLPETIEKVRDKILQRMQTKTQSEWMDIFIEHGRIVAHPYQLPEEALDDPDMTQNGHVTELDGIKQLGPMANLTATSAEVTQRTKIGSRWHVPPLKEDRSAPLDGITVLEIATIIATPMATSFLSDLGARVIKVEAIGGDPFRSMVGQGAARSNLGKESIGIDLKTPEGQTIVHKLAAKADIVLHNYRPGVPQRLGISYEDLRAINPRLIYLSANGYGPAGPGAKRPSTHPIPGAAMGGAAYQAGGISEDIMDIQALRETSRRLFRANELNPDPNTAVVICAAALMGLTAQRITGTGQEIFVDMFGANGYANFDTMIDYQGKPKRSSLGTDLKGAHPLYRLYATEDGWVFLGIKRIQEWTALSKLTGSDWQQRFPSPLEDNDPALLSTLIEFFKQKTSREWEDYFSESEVACVVADEKNSYQFFFDECKEDSPWMMQAPHPTLEPFYRHKPMIDFSVSDLSPGTTQSAGEHADQLMTEIAYSPTEISQYFEKGILWCQPADT